ncbi:MAG: glycoside hydrolase family 16 protein [Oscillospiraceae bacterium]|jgi:beta-glucanase (GH16 family)|nr:glycoside hydrolase family 16 protein [Oscillospiraceae bacterium]
MKQLRISLVSVLLAGLNALLSFFGVPCLPNGAKRVDLTKFELAWHDEFSGSALNTDVWGIYGGTSPVKRRDGYWDLAQCIVEGGKLHIRTAYIPEGIGANPAGWYSCGIDTRNSFSQCYGYFEVRAILPAGTDMWAAFWLYCNGVTNENGAGEDGTEIDVFESPFYEPDRLFKNCVASNMYWNGYGEKGESWQQGSWGKPYAVSNPYSVYHTYGLEWNESGYTFYIDGMETEHTTAGGVSRVPEFLWLSVETDWDNATETGVTGPATDYIIDYVRVYRYAESAEAQ